MVINYHVTRLLRHSIFLIVLGVVVVGESIAKSCEPLVLEAVVAVRIGSTRLASTRNF